MPSTQATSRHFLITGGAGFIGSHLSEALLERGNSVTIIDNLSTGRFGNIEHLVQRHGKGPKSSFRFAIDTITNEGVLDRLASRCDTIIHLAAAVGVRLIVERPAETIETNVMGTESVLRVARRYRCKVLLASTSEVYGKSDKVPFREDDDTLLGPSGRSRWAYAASKLVDEFLALAYYREYGLPIVIFRLFNVVGPRQTGRYGMVVPRLVRQALGGEPLTVYGDGRQSRCFLHVSDAVQAILALSDNQRALGQVFNVGTQEEVSILELARKILSICGTPEDASPISLIPYEEAYQEGFEDMRRRVPEIERIRALTGWRPQKGLDTLLQEVIAGERKRRSES